MISDEQYWYMHWLLRIVLYIGVILTADETVGKIRIHHEGTYLIGGPNSLAEAFTGFILYFRHPVCIFYKVRECNIPSRHH